MSALGQECGHAVHTRDFILGEDVTQRLKQVFRRGIFGNTLCQLLLSEIKVKGHCCLPLESRFAILSQNGVLLSRQIRLPEKGFRQEPAPGSSNVSAKTMQLQAAIKQGSPHPAGAAIG